MVNFWKRYTAVAKDRFIYRRNLITIIMGLSDLDIYRIGNSLDLAYHSKIKILKSLEELKTEGFLKMSNEIKNFLNANYRSVKYKNKLNILDILELSDSDFQDFIKIYKSKEKEIGVPINKGQVYVKSLKNKRRYLLIFTALYVFIMLALLPLIFVFYLKNWLIYDSIITIPWLLSLVYVIILSRRIYKFNKKLSIKYNNKEYIPPLKLDISKIEWIKNEVNYDFPMFVKNAIDYVMSLPNTVKCSVCGGSGQVREPRHHVEYTIQTESVPLKPYDIGYDHDYFYSTGTIRPPREVSRTEIVRTGEETIEWVPVKCKHCGGVGHFYIQGTKDKIRAHGYELINDFNNFLNTHPNLNDEIQRLNSKLQIYISRLRLINDTFYS